jgi:hypothetical protein
MATVSNNPIEQNSSAAPNPTAEMLHLKEALSEIEASWLSGAAITAYYWLYLRRLARHGGKNNVTNQRRSLAVAQWHHR